MAGTVRWANDRTDAIAEQDLGTAAMVHRYVFAPGIDEPVVQYDGSGTGTRRFLSADERGSVISLSDGSGGLVAINAYDEYGRPGSGNSGMFHMPGRSGSAGSAPTITRRGRTSRVSAPSRKRTRSGIQRARTFTHT